MASRVWLFGDNVDTDLIIPARYLNTHDPKALAEHCMEDARSDFASEVRPGDVIVAGRNFGCGSSREHAPIAIKACGVACCIAESYARIFYRNAINIGLPIFESPDLRSAVDDGTEVEADLGKGELRDLNAGTTFSFRPFPEEIRRIIDAGGLIKSIKKAT
jgi:3-isopropylmalate/(R)-2-methylmalate dehydratase small subunit